MLLSNWAPWEIHLFGGAYILKAAKIPLADADKTVAHYWGVRELLTGLEICHSMLMEIFIFKRYNKISIEDDLSSEIY